MHRAHRPSTLKGRTKVLSSEDWPPTSNKKPLSNLCRTQLEPTNPGLGRGLRCRVQVNLRTSSTLGIIPVVVLA